MVTVSKGNSGRERERASNRGSQVRGGSGEAATEGPALASGVRIDVDVRASWGESITQRLHEGRQPILWPR